MKKRYFLVDSENIQNRFFEIMHNARKHDKIIVFYTEYHSGKLDEYMKSTTVKRENVEFVECIAGENALDLQLMGVLAYLIQKHPRRGYIIYSNDKGYTAAVQHWQHLHVDVELIDFQEPMIISNTHAYEFIPKPKYNPKHHSSSGTHKPFRLKKKEEEESAPRSPRKPRSGTTGKGRQSSKSTASAPESAAQGRSTTATSPHPAAPSAAEPAAQGRYPTAPMKPPAAPPPAGPAAQGRAPTAPMKPPVAPPSVEPTAQGRYQAPSQKAPFAPSPEGTPAQGHYQPRYSGPQPKPTYYAAQPLESEFPSARPPKNTHSQPAAADVTPVNPHNASKQEPAPRAASDKPVSREEKTEMIVKPRTDIVPRSAVIVDALFPSKKQTPPSRPKPQNTAAPATFSSGSAQGNRPTTKAPEASMTTKTEMGSPSTTTEPPVPAVNKPKTKTPAAADSKPKTETPAATDSKPKTETPIASDSKSKAETPAAADNKSKVETPVAADNKSKVETPAAADNKSKVETPVAADSNPKAEPSVAATPNETNSAAPAPAARKKQKASTASTDTKPASTPAAKQKSPAVPDGKGLSNEEVIAALCRSFPAGDLSLVNRMLSICFGTVGAKEFYARFKSDEAYREQMAALYLPGKEERLSSLVQTALKWNGHTLEQADSICRIIREGSSDNMQGIYHRFVKELPGNLTERQALYRAIKPYLAVIESL